ncbi:hypothetical protein B0H17DRAFT_953088, partial [Mycena rosella]
AKMEIGSPMAAMYLLGQPDHYASHPYVCTLCVATFNTFNLFARFGYRLYPRTISRTVKPTRRGFRLLIRMVSSLHLQV